jgi:TM2 domain-containing membrane protein YozV
MFKVEGQWMAFCGECGSSLKEDANFCGECGNRTVKEKGPVSELSVRPAQVQIERATPAAYPYQRSDLHTAMRYDANKKSAGVAYVLWFVFGALGVHRFYLHRIASGIIQLLLLVFGIILLFAGIGLFLLIAVSIWWFVDAALIPGLVREYNREVADNLAF